MINLAWVQGDLGRQEATAPKGPLPLLLPRRSWEKGVGGHSQEVGDILLPKGLVEQQEGAPEEGPKLKLKEPHCEDLIGCYCLSAPAFGRVLEDKYWGAELEAEVQSSCLLTWPTLRNLDLTFVMLDCFIGTQ